MLVSVFLFFKQKTAYEVRISDWSSDVCSSDLNGGIDAWMVTIGAVPRTFLASCASAHPPAPGYLPARPHEMAGVAGGIPLQVVLMLGLGFPEVTGRLHLRHHLASGQIGRAHV